MRRLEASKLTPERVNLFARGNVETLARHIVKAGLPLGLRSLPAERGESVIARAPPTAGAYQRFGPDLAVPVSRRSLRGTGEAPNPGGSFFFWTRTARGVSRCHPTAL